MMSDYTAPPSWSTRSESIPETFIEYINKTSIPKGFWRKNSELIVENVRAWCDWYALYRGFTSFNDWYNITGEEINKKGGSGFFTTKIVKESPYILMSLVYDQYPWKPYKFKQAPQGYFKDINNRFTVFKDFCNDYLNQKEGFDDFDYTNIDHLYKLQLSHFECTEYYGVLRCYNESFIEMIKDFIGNKLIPEMELQEWKFRGQVPKNFWGGKAPNRETITRCFNDEIVKGLNFDTKEKMYKLTQPIISSTGLNTPLMNYFSGSPMKLLEFVFPDEKWLFWKFVSAPNNAWDSIKNQRAFLQDTLGNKPSTDLYNYNVREDLPHGLTIKYKSLYDLAKTVYPEIKWEKQLFNKLKTITKLLEYLTEVCSLTCETEVSLCKGRYNKYFKMDIYIVELNLYIELDGDQHFKTVWRTPITPIVQRRRDIFKIREAQKQNKRCIRLYQPELVGKTHSWMDDNIKPYLVKSDSLEPVFLCVDVEKYSNIYGEHIALYKSDILVTLDLCYPENGGCVIPDSTIIPNGGAGKE
jgi:hypothetical protein